jgi:hypothetical protein
MKRSLPLFLLALLSGAALVSAKDHAMAQGPRHSEPIPLPRDGDVAVREEFEAARRSGTREALDLFIARHPQHALAATARQERDRLTSK